MQHQTTQQSSTPQPCFRLQAGKRLQHILRLATVHHVRTLRLERREPVALTALLCAHRRGKAVGDAGPKHEVSLVPRTARMQGASSAERARPNHMISEYPQTPSLSPPVYEWRFARCSVRKARSTPASNNSC